MFADAPGGTQVPSTVIEAMAEYLRERNANTGGAFVTSRETEELIERARRAGADLLGCDPDEVVFGANTTSLAFALSRSLARLLEPGDEVVVTVLDHDANIAPWLASAEDRGASVRWVDLHDEDCSLDLDGLVAALGSRTRVVAFTLASNALGTVTPADEIVRLVRERAPQAVVIGDAVHLAQHRSLDAHALGLDVMFCSPYKVFGPHLGVMSIRREAQAAWLPQKVRPQYDTPPDRWETGTLPHEALAGFVAAVDYLADLSGGGPRAEAVPAAMEWIRRYEESLSDRFLAGLAEIRGPRLYGTTEVKGRTPTFALRLGDLHPRAVAEELARRGIFVWDGNYFALAIMQRLGLESTGGAVRVGFCHYNTPDEVDRVLDEIGRIAERLSLSR